MTSAISRLTPFRKSLGEIKQKHFKVLTLVYQLVNFGPELQFQVFGSQVLPVVLSLPVVLGISLCQFCVHRDWRSGVPSAGVTLLSCVREPAGEHKVPGWALTHTLCLS